jgi:hypothetical protein
MGEQARNMSALITSVEHALATAASDTVKVAKFVETSVLPVLKKAQADQSTIEAVTGLVSPQAAGTQGISRNPFCSIVISRLRDPYEPKDPEVIL